MYFKKPKVTPHADWRRLTLYDALKPLIAMKGAFTHRKARPYATTLAKKSLFRNSIPWFFFSSAWKNGPMWGEPVEWRGLSESLAEATEEEAPAAAQEGVQI